MANVQTILKACRVGDLNLLKAIIDEYPDCINETDNKLGWTGLYCSVMCGHLDLAKYLLKHKAKVNIQNRMGETALHQAVEGKNKQMVEILLRYAADPNIQQNDGETALHLAVLQRNNKIVKMLMQNGADPNIPNLLYGKTPVHYAAESGSEEILETFANFDSDFLVKDKKGNTPESLKDVSEKKSSKTLRKISPENSGTLCLTQQLSPTYTRCNSDISLLTDYRGIESKIKQIELMHRQIREKVRTSVDHKLGYSSILEPDSEKTISEVKVLPVSLRPDLYRWLKSLKLLEEYELLVNAGYDDIPQLLKQMRSGLPLTEKALLKIGMKKPGHRRRILASLDKLSRKTDESGLLAQLHCCLNIPNSLWGKNLDTLEKWLGELNLVEVEIFFREAGFEEIEDIVGLVGTNWEIDETLLMDIGIEKPGHRHRVLARLREYGEIKDKVDDEVIDRSSNSTACALCSVM